MKPIFRSRNIPVALAAALAGITFGSCDLYQSASAKDPVAATVRNNLADAVVRDSTTGLKPDDETVVRTTLPRLTLPEIEGVSAFDVQIGTDLGFILTPAYEGRGIEAGLHLIGQELLDGHTYFWRIRSIYEDSMRGPWLSPREFRVGLPEGPTISGLMNSWDGPVPFMSWDSSSGCDTYNVQISTDSDFTQILSDQNVRSYSYAYSTALLQTSRSYYWRVRGFGPDLQTRWSQVQQLHTWTNTWHYSATQEFGQSHASFSWSGYENAISGFDFQLALTPSFDDPSLENQYTRWQSLTCLTELLPNTDYWWRIRTRYYGDLVGDWCEAKPFRSSPKSILIPSPSIYPEAAPSILRDAVVYRNGSGLAAMNWDGTTTWTATASQRICRQIAPALGGVIYSSWYDFLDIDRYYLLAHSAGGQALRSREIPENFSIAGIGRDGEAILATNSWKLIAIDQSGSVLHDFAPTTTITGQGKNPATVGGDGSIYANLGDSVIALNPDFTLRWQKSFDNAASDTNPISIGHDGRLYVVTSSWMTSSGKLSAVDALDGDILWSRAISLPAEPIVRADGAVLAMETAQVGGEWKVFIVALDADGNESWRGGGMIQLSLPPMSTRPELAVGSDGTVFCLYGSRISAIGTNGQILWSTPDPQSGSVNAWALLPDGNLVMIVSGSCYRIQTSSPGLAASSWPTSRHDNMRTGRADAQ